MLNITRSHCRKEPPKYVPIYATVQVAQLPDNFPKSCNKMIGKEYPAIVHTDRRGKTWYKILCELVFGDKSERCSFGYVSEVKDEDEDKVSFINRKYISLQEKYCF